MASRSAREGPCSTTSMDELQTDLSNELPAVLARNGMGGFLWDLDRDRIYVDAGGLAAFELTPEEFNGRIEALNTHIVPEEIPALWALVNETVRRRQSTDAYFRVNRSDGGVRWVHVQANVRRDESGRAHRVMGIIRDASRELKHVAQQAALGTERRRQTDVVHATTSALSRALTIEDVQAALGSDEVLNAVGAIGISISLIEQGGATLRRLGSDRMPSFLITDMRFTRIEDGLPSSDVLRTGMPVFLDRAATERRYPSVWESVRETDVTLGAVLPLVAQSQPIGTMVILYEGKESFSPEERNLLLALASAVAQSVQRAALYDQDHAMAIGLQEAMLPSRIPEVPGTRIAVRYRPGRTGHQIGGDWYDVLPLPTGRVGLVVGDVQGHDIHASAVMGQLRTALRAYAAEGHPPATLMARASAFLHDLDTDRFATCLYVDVDPVSGHTQFIRAGHHGPLLKHADGSTSRPQLQGGLPLGLPQYDSDPYPTTHLQMNPHETLLLCTDGLIELPGMDLDEGLSRVEDGLRDGPADLDQLAEQIVTTRIDSGRRQEDDIALLLVSITGSGSGPAGVAEDASAS